MKKSQVAQVTTQRKGEVGLVLTIAKGLKRVLNGRAIKYRYFELKKNIVIQENKFPRLV